MSLDVQRRQIEGYAHMHGLTLTEVLVEGGVSGSLPVEERPVGGALFARLQKGDIVIAAKLDRLVSGLPRSSIFPGLAGTPARLHWRVGCFWGFVLRIGANRPTRVVLAAAHLDSDPTNNRLKNLRALCQRCHMLQDRPHHLALD